MSARGLEGGGRRRHNPFPVSVRRNDRNRYASMCAGPRSIIRGNSHGAAASCQLGWPRLGATAPQAPGTHWAVRQANPTQSGGTGPIERGWTMRQHEDTPLGAPQMHANSSKIRGSIGKRAQNLSEKRCTFTTHFDPSKPFSTRKGALRVTTTLPTHPQTRDRGQCGVSTNALCPVVSRFSAKRPR